MAEEEVGQEKKGGKLKWIIIGVVLLAILGAGGYFGYTMFLAPQEDEAASQEAAPEGDAAEEQPLENLEGVLTPLPVFLVNLADPLGRRYLKLGLEVEMRDPESVALLDTRQAQIKDTLLMLLSSKTYDSLSTMQDKMELKQEIADRLNQIVGKGKVLRVYITEMVIQ